MSKRTRTIAELVKRMNLSELVQVAQGIDERVHRGLGREVLVEVILAGQAPELPERAVDKVRLRIMGFILDNWDQVKPLVQCPARTGNPRACFQCTDVQAILCFDENKKVIEEAAKKDE